MSTRGLKFLDKWALKQLPIVARGEPLDASDLKDQSMGAGGRRSAAYLGASNRY